MQLSFRLQFSFVLVCLTSLASAWPIWPRWLPDLDTIVVRADSSNSTTVTTVIQTGSSTSVTSFAPPTTTPSGSSSTGTATGTGTSGTITTGPTFKPSGSKTTSTVAHSTSFDASYPAGAASMVTPAVSLGEQYFKIGDFVTFVWNYTNVLAPPSSVNVVASASAVIYPIAINQTVEANSTGIAVWDTAAYQSSAPEAQLRTQMYTLVIYDANSSMTANAQPGYLAPFNQYTFGMYIRQDYQNLSDYQCATCNGAMSSLNGNALHMAMWMGFATVLSFTWFVTGLNVIW